MTNKILTLAAASLFSLTTLAQGWQIGGGMHGGGMGHHGQDHSHSYSPHYRGTSNSVLDLFTGSHQDAPLNVSIGYVNKGWVTDFGDYTWRENMWGQEGKKLHGVQMGIAYQPCNPFGLGLRTGLFYEAYFSEANGVKEQGFDSFTEHNLYIPLHAMYRIPLGYTTSLSIYGGLGFNWAIYGEYTDKGFTYYDYDGYSHYDGPVMYQPYGRDSWPRHVNFQTEWGIDLRVKNFKIGTTFSHGLTNHRFYQGQKTRQNKFGLNIGYVVEL